METQATTAAERPWRGWVSRSRTIIAQVAAEHGITAGMLLSDGRTATIAAARRQAVRDVKAAEPHLSTTQLGRIFGRDHSTICHYLGTTERSRAGSPKAAVEVAEVVPLRALPGLFRRMGRARLMAAALVGFYPAEVSPGMLEAVTADDQPRSPRWLRLALHRMRATLEPRGWMIVESDTGGLRLVERVRAS